MIQYIENILSGMNITQHHKKADTLNFSVIELKPINSISLSDSVIQ